MPIAVGVPDDVASYLRERYGPGLLGDVARVELHSAPGELQQIVLTLIVHRERREGEA